MEDFVESRTNSCEEQRDRMDGDGVLFETVPSPIEPLPQAQLRPTDYSEKAIPEFDERDYRSEYP